jgi:hypothetical protein
VRGERLRLDTSRGAPSSLFQPLAHVGPQADADIAVPDPVIDAGPGRPTGSEDLSWTSLTRNREVIVVEESSSAPIVATLARDV